MDLCKKCDTILGNRNGKRKIPYCSKHRHIFYGETNKAKIKARNAAWWVNNKERGKQIHEAWRKANPEKWNAKQRKQNRSLSGQFNHGRLKAKNYNQEWTLTREEFAVLRSKACDYCNGQLNPTGSGLDRKDCSKGYTMDNVVPCCGTCNTFKNDKFSYSEMKVAMMAVLDLRKPYVNFF
jgi:hypothetical protein